MAVLKKTLFFIALTIQSSTSFSRAPSLGDVAGNALQPVTGLVHLVNLASIIIGIGLLIGAYSQYRQHRQSEQSVRISTPIVLALLGLALIALPMIASYTESGHFLP